MLLPAFERVELIMRIGDMSRQRQYAAAESKQEKAEAQDHTKSRADVKQEEEGTFYAVVLQSEFRVTVEHAPFQLLGKAWVHLDV